MFEIIIDATQTSPAPSPSHLRVPDGLRCKFLALFCPFNVHSYGCACAARKHALISCTNAHFRPTDSTHTHYTQSSVRLHARIHCAVHIIKCAIAFRGGGGSGGTLGRVCACVRSHARFLARPQPGVPQDWRWRLQPNQRTHTKRSRLCDGWLAGLLSLRWRLWLAVRAYAVYALECADPPSVCLVRVAVMPPLSRNARKHTHTYLHKAALRCTPAAATTPPSTVAFVSRRSFIQVGAPSIASEHALRVCVRVTVLVLKCIARAHFV